MRVYELTYRGERRSMVTRAAMMLALAGVAGVASYVFVLRPRLLRWGATDAEVAGTIPGDELVRQPDYVTTRAVTIHARPEEIWPWLAQMGYRRGGLYSYDWLHRIFGYLDRPSATEILDEFQQLRAGDTIPVGRGANWPVRTADSPHALVLEPVSGAITWAFTIVPRDGRTTRLVTRVRCRIERTLPAMLGFAVIDPAAFLMTRRMLLNIKRRAEELARRRRG